MWAGEGSGRSFPLLRSCLLADVRQGFELGAQRVEEAQVVVVAEVAAAADGAGRGPRPLEPVVVGDVLGVAFVLLRVQDRQLLRDKSGSLSRRVS